MAVDYNELLRRLQAQPASVPPNPPLHPSPYAPPLQPTHAGLGGQPTTPPVETPSADTGGSWNIPDYGALLAQFMAPLDAQYNAQNVSNLASRNAGFKRAAIQFGELPDVNQIAQALGLSQSDLGNVFGSDTAQLAQGNTQAGTSTVARLAQTHQDAVRGITNALASRGLLHSGETGYQQGRENQNYTISQYDARNKLLDYLSGLQSGYASAAQQAAMARAQARMNAAMQIQGAYQPTYIPGQSAPPPPASPSGSFVRQAAQGFSAPPPPSRIAIGRLQFPWGHQPA